jgi:hypothetical protein
MDTNGNNAVIYLSGAPDVKVIAGNVIAAKHGQRRQRVRVFHGQRG